MSKMDDILVMAAEDYEKEMGVDFDTAMKWAQTQPLSELFRRHEHVWKGKEMDNWYEIIFDKNSSQWYVNENDSEEAFEFNYTLVKNLMNETDLRTKTIGFTYLRALYNQLGLNPLSVSPILGWDKEQNPKFNYIIETDHENERIIIKVNPIKLKSE